MTPSKIRAKIARCIELERMLATLTDELKANKTLLIAEAQHDEERQTPTDGGGWSWTHADSDGNIVRVTQPADKLKGKLDPEAKTFAKVREIAGDAFGDLFEKAVVYKPIDRFRHTAEMLLARGHANRLIHLVTTESAPQVAFEVKEGA